MLSYTEEPAKRTLEYEESRVLGGQKISNVGRVLTYAFIIPMYTGSIGGSYNRRLGV